MKKLREIILKKIGCMTALPKEEKEALQPLVITYEDFPIDGYFYQVGNFVLAFPTKTALREMRSCEWGVVTDLQTNEPLALVPTIPYKAAERLHAICQKRIFIIAVGSNQVYCGDYPTFSYEAESVWIPLCKITD